MAAELLSAFPPRAPDANNNPYSGAKWYFYQSGTLTPQAVYANATLATSLGATVTADGSGKFVPIYFDAALSYRGILKDASGGVTIYDIDPINPALAAATGAGQFGFSQANTYEAGTVGGKLKGMKFVTDAPYGATASGDDTAAITAANASAGYKYAPRGIYDTALASSALDGPFWGEGQIRDAANNLRAPWFSAVKSVPTALGNWDSIETAFNGDLSKVLMAFEHRISGAATLGQPATGYRNNQEAGAILGYGRNTSGHNEALDGNDGRTLGHLLFLKADNYGQGDYAALTFSAVVAGARAGATSWLANPAAVFLNGTITAGSDGVYLNPSELDLQFNGKDAAGVGHVVNMNRTVGDTVPGLGAYAGGFRAQSTGSYAVDAGFVAGGLFKVGLDLSPALWDANKAGIALSKSTRMYLNAVCANNQTATALGNVWISYDDIGLSSFINFIANGTSCLQINDDGILATVPFKLPVTTVGALPPAIAASAGKCMMVTDANSSTFHAVAVGGGANFVPVHCTGAQWLIG